jgi:hypothetical protein
MMSVMEIVNQVRTLSQVEQAELFQAIHQLEEEQKILEQFNVLTREPMQDPVIEIPENQVDYVLKLLEQEKIRLS